MSVRAVPEVAVMFVAEQENCVLRVYDDARPGAILGPGSDVRGKLTAGYGHTSPALQIGQQVDASQAKIWLQDDLAIAALRLCRVVDDPVISELTDYQYSALLSFVFNVGVDQKWTIWKRLNSHDFDQVPLELMKFVNQTVDGQSQKVTGLVNRRAAEVSLWATHEPGTLPSEPPSSITRIAQTTPTPSDPVPAGKSKGLIAGVLGGITAAPPMIDSAIHAIEPYSRHSHASSVMLGILATLGSICAGVTIFYVYRQKQNARN